MGLAFKRIELIKKLCEEHPAEVQMVNDKFAHYTGGMKDSGDLNFRHCLFEASITELEEVLKTTILRRMTKAMTSEEDALRHKATIAMELLKQQRKPPVTPKDKVAIAAMEMLLNEKK